MNYINMSYRQRQNKRDRRTDYRYDVSLNKLNVFEMFCLIIYITFEPGICLRSRKFG